MDAYSARSSARVGDAEPDATDIGLVQQPHGLQDDRERDRRHDRLELGCSRHQVRLRKGNPRFEQCGSDLPVAEVGRAGGGLGQRSERGRARRPAVSGQRTSGAFDGAIDGHAVGAQLGGSWALRKHRVNDQRTTMRLHGLGQCS